jgi:hypothetical protein
MITPMGIILSIILSALVILRMHVADAKASHWSEKKQVFQLPRPRAEGGMALAKALAKRRPARVLFEAAVLEGGCPTVLGRSGHYG